METKEKCDGNCQTCPTEYRIFCTLMLQKNNNELLKSLSERVKFIEEKVCKEQDANVLMPLNDMQEEQNPHAQDE